MKHKFKSKILFAAAALLGTSLLFTACSGESENANTNEIPTMEQNQISSSDVEYYTCSMHPNVKMSQPGECPICGMDLKPASEVEAHGDSMESHEEMEHMDASEDAMYTCPMHPDVVQKGPGECPECGMDLVVMDEEHTGHEHQMNAGE